METAHEIRVGDAADMAALDDGSVELVVTSPPYPMIEMWDGLFAELDPAVGDRLDGGDGEAAFQRMHDALDEVWAEVERVLAPGGVACVNVGDATRTLDDRFRLYPNHAEVISRLTDRGLTPLPDVLWRKPSNRLTKFMGSGMLPTNAYASLEHEYVLIFRNGDPREFEAGAPRRYESAYFWEERNEWFSDLWTDVQGTIQALDNGDLRDRSGAFPLAIPYRLISMFSVYGDTVLDPFWGTGTTTLAAMLAGRDSVGYELDAEFVEVFDDRLTDLPDRSRSLLEARLDRHREFVRERRDAGEVPSYEAEHHEFPVVTRQETDVEFYAVERVRETAEGYAVEHAPFRPDG